MKKLITFLSLGILLIFTACDSINKELIADIQAKTSEYSEKMPEFEKTVTDVNNLSQMLLETPVALQSDPTLGTVHRQIIEKISSLTMRCNAMKSQYADLGGKLTAIASDYTTGKLKTDAVKSEFETIVTGMTELSEGFKKNNATYEDASTMYSKMMATYKSKTEVK
jgi:uncharacterized coiled-coil DUF342 family protein